MLVKNFKSLCRLSTIFMPTVRLETPHTCVMFQQNSGIQVSNEKFNRCYHFLQVAHSECATCPNAVSIWSPNSWVGKRGTFRAWTAKVSCGQAGTRSQRALRATALPPPRLTSSPVVSRSWSQTWSSRARFPPLFRCVTPGDVCNKLVFSSHKTKKSPPFW